MYRKLLYKIVVLGMLISAPSLSAQAQGDSIVTPAGQFPIVTEPVTLKILLVESIKRSAERNLKQNYTCEKQVVFD